jgi:hypothetical protein
MFSKIYYNDYCYHYAIKFGYKKKLVDPQNKAWLMSVILAKADWRAF